jgi:hypothetical protein
MKSMSMDAHGSASLSWVCRCSNGLRSTSSPVIHILAGENVCIQAITPTHDGSLLAACITSRIAAASVSTGRHTSSTLTAPESVSARWIRCDWPATWSRVSAP